MAEWKHGDRVRVHGTNRYGTIIKDSTVPSNANYGIEWDEDYKCEWLWDWSTLEPADLNPRIEYPWEREP